MHERLQWILKKPATWLHWDPLRGGLQAHDLVAQHYPDAACFVPETHMGRAQAAIKKEATPWWSLARWRSHDTAWKAPVAPVAMLWANMALHMDPDPQALITHWHGLLEVNGFLMFSCLGPDTLKELRALYRERGWPDPSHEFTDMHDWGDMLVAAGFAEPVMDMERINLTFETPQRLLQELRGLGRNLHVDRFPGLRGRGWHATLLEALASLPLRLTFEVIYGHAYKPAQRLRVEAHSEISLTDMRAALRSGKIAGGVKLAGDKA
jgi:malonyl-CoA O-methyltransferase